MSNKKDPRLILLLTLILFCISLGFVEKSVAEIMLGTTTIAIIFAPFFLKKIEVYEPYFAVSIFFTLTYCLSLFFIKSDYEQRLYLHEESIIYARLFILIFYLLFVLGYFSIRKEWRPQSPLIVNRIAVINIPIKFYIVAIILSVSSRLLTILQGSYFHGMGELDNTNTLGVWSNIVFTCNILIYPIIILLLIHYKLTRKRIVLILFWLSAIISLLYELPRGSKEGVGVIFIYIFIGFSFIRHTKIKLIHSLFVISLVLLIFSFYKFYRTKAYSGKIPSLSEAIDEYSSNSDNMELSNAVETTVGRLDHTGILAIIIQKDDTYLLGETYAQLIYQPIPRFIWPDKPVKISGNEFGRQIGLLSPVDRQTSVSRGWLGEAFMNFGIWSVLLGFFFGLFYAWIYNFFFFKKLYLKPISIALYPVFLIALIEGNLIAYELAGALKQALIFISLFIIIKDIDS